MFCFLDMSVITYQKSYEMRVVEHVEKSGESLGLVNFTIQENKIIRKTFILFCARNIHSAKNGLSDEVVPFHSFVGEVFVSPTIFYLLTKLSTCLVIVFVIVA